MKITEFTPTDAERENCLKLFGWTPPSSEIALDLFRLTFSEDEKFGYLAVLRRHSYQEGAVHWCNWLLLAVASHNEDGSLGFSNMGEHSLVDVVEDDIEADGFCKWDGCREIRSNTHVCSGSGFVEYLQALGWTVFAAARAAGYEEEGK